MCRVLNPVPAEPVKTLSDVVVHREDIVDLNVCAG